MGDAPNDRIFGQESPRQGHQGSQPMSVVYFGPCGTVQGVAHTKRDRTHALNGYQEACLVLECEENHLRSRAREPVNDHCNNKHSIEQTLS